MQKITIVHLNSTNDLIHHLHPSISELHIGLLEILDPIGQEAGQRHQENQHGHSGQHTRTCFVRIKTNYGQIS